jgi:hypothetical protein
MPRAGSRAIPRLLPDTVGDTVRRPSCGYNLLDPHFIYLVMRLINSDGAGPWPCLLVWLEYDQIICLMKRSLQENLSS